MPQKTAVAVAVIFAVIFVGVWLFFPNRNIFMFCYGCFFYWSLAKFPAKAHQNNTRARSSHIPFYPLCLEISLDSIKKT